MSPLPKRIEQDFPRSLGEPLFDLPLSGWYWQVTRLDRAQAGRALLALVVGRRAAASRRSGSVAGCRRRAHGGYADGPEGQRLRMVERTIDLGEEGRYLVAVAGDAAEIEEETRSFD